MDLRSELGKEIETMRDIEKKKEKKKEDKQHKKDKEEKRKSSSGSSRKKNPEDSIPDNLPPGVTKEMVLQLRQMEMLSKKLHEQAIKEGRIRPESAEETEKQKKLADDLLQAKGKLAESQRKRDELMLSLKQVRDEMGSGKKSPEELKRLAAEEKRRQAMLDEMRADMNSAKDDVKTREEEKARIILEAGEAEKEIAAYEEADAAGDAQ